MAEARKLLPIALVAIIGVVGAFVAWAVLVGRNDERAVPAANAPPVTPPGEVRVEVLNGAGTAGLAREGTQALRDAGFDVVFFGNAGRFDHGRSVAIDRVGVVDRARAVATALGIDSVAVAVDSSLLLDVTVILGDDWPPPPATPEDWKTRLRGVVGRDSTGGP